jgi:hypothetical protein
MLRGLPWIRHRVKLVSLHHLVHISDPSTCLVPLPLGWSTGHRLGFGSIPRPFRASRIPK